jgi:hypothetical protein
MIKIIKEKPALSKKGGLFYNDFLLVTQLLFAQSHKNADTKAT